MVRNKGIFLQIQVLVLVAEFLAMMLLLVESLQEAEARGHETLKAQQRLRLDLAV